MLNHQEEKDLLAALSIAAVSLAQEAKRLGANVSPELEAAIATIAELRPHVRSHDAVTPLTPQSPS